MPFTIERNDLAHMAVDAVVVAANEHLQITGGVGAAVAQAAGAQLLQEACDQVGYCATGSAVVTPGFNLPARFVVHAVGPVWRDGSDEERRLLASAYDQALSRAEQAGARSIALPLLSAGTFGCPVDVSFALALAAVREFLEIHDADVRIVLFDRAAVAAGLAAYGDIASYIDDRYVEEREEFFDRERRMASMLDDASYPLPGGAPAASFGAARMAPPQPDAAAAPIPARKKRRWGFPDLRRRPRESSQVEKEAEVGDEADQAFSAPVAPGDTGALPAAPAPVLAPSASLDDWLDGIDEPFSTTLLALIDARGLTDAQVYKRANMSRQLFSKIRSDAAYRPTKKTVLALAIALGLDLDEATDLLRRAGFALSHSSKADIIVEYFISRGQCDIFAINEALYAFDQPLL